MPFDSPDINLGSLLREIDAGKIQLPDFQREWKWDDDRIRSLLASIARDHPVGVVMMLAVDGDRTRFAPTPISGVNQGKVEQPQQLILDGQQRLTSLYQSLFYQKPVRTMDVRGKRMSRWYYLDMNRAIGPNGDVEEAILSVPEDRVIRDDFGRNIVADYSTVDHECAAGMFPLWKVFDNAAIFAWHGRYVAQDSARSAEFIDRWNYFYQAVLTNFIQYTIPAIVLNKETPKEAVCTVFEKVNTGGVPLNVFELLTATFAAENFRLKQDWSDRKAELNRRPALHGVESTDLLQSVALLATRQRRLAYEARLGEPDRAPAIGCKRRDILNLSLDEYRNWSGPVTDALVWAASFLAREFIFSRGDVPYRTQLVPLAAIRVVLGKAADDFAVYDRLRKWFWCGVLGELYGGTTETRFARDIEQVPAWASGDGAPPISVVDAVFREQRLMTLRTRNSAAYKGIYALLMQAGSLDWLKHQPMNMATFFDYQVDIHHVFPKAWCAKHGIADSQRESIVNKTAISGETNRIIGGRAPSEYLLTLQNRGGGLDPARLDSIIATHAIEPAHLRTDDFDAYFSARKEALISLITEAMGKEVIRDADLVEVPEEFEAEEPEIDVDDLLLGNL